MKVKPIIEVPEKTVLAEAIEDHFLSEEETVEMFGDKQARWYQIAARHGVEEALLLNPLARVLVVQPTGSGKTLSSGLIFTSDRIRKALGVPSDRKLRLLFVAHRHRLLTQAERAYAAAENVEFITHMAFQQLPKELLDQGWDITCIDEAHHEAMTTIQYHLELLGNHPIIGLTATPNRADGCVIKFEFIVNPISREQAVLEGWLAPTRIHSFIDTPQPNKLPILTDVFQNFGHQMGQGMVFVRTLVEVRALDTILNGMGYNTIGITNQDGTELDFILDEFSRGNVQFVVNCKKISEGVDVLGCTDVILGRQFGSYPDLNQVIGRASRPDSDCNVWELINPLSGRNLDTTVVVGTPEYHRLVSKEGGKWVEREFDYVSHRSNRQLGVASGNRIR